MANEFARNIQDASVNPVAFALPNAASTSTNSTAIDLGAAVYRNENYELELAIPALSTTIAPDTRTVTLIVETSTASNFATIVRQILNVVLTGAGGVGIPASVYRCRIPSDCERYVRFKVTFGASTTDGSALNATGTVRF